MANAFLLILNKEASEVSVPSKIYSYLSAGKPILGLIPKNNLAAKKIIQYKSGYIINTSNVNLAVNRIKSIIKNKKKLFRTDKEKYLSGKKNSLLKIEKIINSINNDK
jgi:hypothetical protein